VASVLLLPLLVAALSADSPTANAQETGLAFGSVGGSEWWVQTRLSGTWATQVLSVQARDTGGSWVPLSLQSWSGCACWWANGFHVEPGHLVLLRAILLGGLAIDSCWYSHPSGLAMCGATEEGGGDPLGLAPLTDLAPDDGRTLVGFATGQLPTLVPGEAIAGLRVLARIPQIDLLVVKAPELTVARTLLGVVPGVSYVEADGAVQGLGIPNDPLFGQQYGPAMMGFPAAWSAAGYGSSSVTVAVLDSGIARTHPDFQGTRILAGYDYVSHDTAPGDDCGHGTHVSGIVGADTNNGIGVAGASQATILPFKVLGPSSGGCSGFVSTIAQAIVDATGQHARIITMSLGTSTDSNALASAVAYAWDHGVILVAAAGNGGRDNTVHYPAAYRQVIAVSALDASKSLASYSSTGPQVEVAAPGTNIESTTSNGGYGLMSGTSMAAPHVAGALALALSCAPETTNQALRVALDATAEDLGPAGRDNGFGYGLVRADRLVAAMCGTAPVANRAPTASFTHSESGLSLSVDGRGSSDTDGDALSYAWTFGDGGGSTMPTASHAYQATGNYLVDLTVSDGRLSVSQTANITLQLPNFIALFAPAKGCNQWWVEVEVAGNAPVASVAASVDGGTWQALPKASWGAWAASFYVAKGSSVVFRATSPTGETALSATYSWLGDPPPAGPFTAFFMPKTLSNPWWVEVAVQGNQHVDRVDFRLDGGAWNPLPKTSWGTWATSIHMSTGAQVIFRATSSTAEVATSDAYTWQ
jgi:serine protease